MVVPAREPKERPPHMGLLEKEELKTKLESFETSSKSLNTLLNSQLSANDKAGFRHNGAKESKVSEIITSVSKVEISNSETSNDKVEMLKIKTVKMSEPIIEEWESDSEDDEIMVKPKEVTKIVKPSFEKIESVNARNETVRQAENPRKNNKSPRGNKRNWNDMMTQKLGENFEFNNKACYGTRVNTARPKAEVNTVKALASWVWKPKHEELAHVSKSNSASKTLTRYDYVDALEKLKLLCVTRVNFGLLNCHSEVAVWIPLKLLLLKLIGVEEFKNYLSDNEESLGEDASKQGRIDDADVEVTFIDETSNDARNKNNKIWIHPLDDQ
ncbi:hypothetical protein Tco_1123438 [Tanacetum coccineum]|uniref:Uncharacterized protein n=1 Tax=Tanacetum coccineum TaxID=301880 RepID=A0ABQ5J6A4_9ASTR